MLSLISMSNLFGINLADFDTEKYRSLLRQAYWNVTDKTIISVLKVSTIIIFTVTDLAAIL